MIIQSRLVVSKATHRASLAKITAGDGSHPPLTKPAAEPGVVNVYLPGSALTWPRWHASRMTPALTFSP